MRLANGVNRRGCRGRRSENGDGWRRASLPHHRVAVPERRGALPECPVQSERLR